MTMECMGRQALACFVGTTESEHKGHFYYTALYSTLKWHSASYALTMVATTSGFPIFSHSS